MATASSISKFCKDKITFYESITDFSTPATNDDVLLTLTPAWDTVDSVVNTPMVTFNSVNSGAGSDKVVLRNIHEPELNSDAATKAYVDGIAVSGVSWKNTAKVSTTADIATFPPTDGITTISTLDTITLVVGDRVLVKDQTDATQNGIYEVTTGTWVRTSDMPDAVSSAGFAIWIDQGLENGDKGYVVTSDAGADVVGTDAIAWSKFSSSQGVAGVDGDIQFANNGGHDAASAGTLNWNNTTSMLTVGGDTAVGPALSISQGDLVIGNGHLELQDNKEARFGTGDDLKIYHDGSHSRIVNDTGALFFENTATNGTNHNMTFKLGENAGATKFYWSSSSANLVEMDSVGALTHLSGSHKLNDNVELYIGSNDGLSFVHDGTDSSMVNDSGELKIQQTASGSDITFENTSNTAGDDMHFKLGGNTNGTSFNFVGDSQGTPETLVQIVAAEEESVSLTTGTIRVKGGGAFTGEVSAMCFNTLSDATTKTNINALNDPLAKIKQIEPYNYNFLPGYGKEGKLNTGVLAQQLESVPGLEHCVNTDADSGYKSVNYIFLIPMLIGAVKTLSEQVKELSE